MFTKQKNEIIEYGKIAWDKGLSPGISGNISMRCGDKILITSSGSANGFLDRDEISVIDFDGNLIEGKKRASSEKYVHIEFYRKRNDVNSICHFHSPYLTAFAQSGIPISEHTLPEMILLFGEIPIAPYVLPGTKELAYEISPFFEKYTVVLMQNHGVISGGRNLKEAYLNLELCENYAKTMILSKILGGVRMLSDNQIEEILACK